MQTVSAIEAEKSIYISTLLKYCIDTEQLGTSILRHYSGWDAIPQEKREAITFGIFHLYIPTPPPLHFIATKISILTLHL